MTLTSCLSVRFTPDELQQFSHALQCSVVPSCLCMRSLCVCVPSALLSVRVSRPSDLCPSSLTMALQTLRGPAVCLFFLGLFSFRYLSLWQYRRLLLTSEVLWWALLRTEGKSEVRALLSAANLMALLARGARGGETTYIAGTLQE